MKTNDNATLAVFDTFFALPDLVSVEITKHVVELVAAIRVKNGLRMPDALQAARRGSFVLERRRHLQAGGGLNVKMLT